MKFTEIVDGLQYEARAKELITKEWRFDKLP